MAEQMERRRGLFPGVSVGVHEARSRREPLYVRMQKAFEDRAETQAEETRRVALEARRVRKTGGAKKSRFQTVFENSRVPEKRGGFVEGDELDVTLDESAAFLPPLSANDQAAARFARQRRYGQIVKRLHAPRVDPDARAEMERAAPTPIGRASRTSRGWCPSRSTRPNRWSPPVASTRACTTRRASGGTPRPKRCTCPTGTRTKSRRRRRISSTTSTGDDARAVRTIRTIVVRTETARSGRSRTIPLTGTSSWEEKRFRTIKRQGASEAASGRCRGRERRSGTRARGDGSISGTGREHPGHTKCTS